MVNSLVTEAAAKEKISGRVLSLAAEPEASLLAFCLLPSADRLLFFAGVQ